MLREIEIGGVYLSRTGMPFRVRDRSWYGANCSVPMIEYTNIIPTKDKPKDHKWVIEETMFLKLFSEIDGEV